MNGPTTVPREVIREAAQAALEELRQHLYDDGGPTPASDPPYGIEPEKIIQIRKISLVEPVEIRLWSADPAAPSRRCAGYMDPEHNTIGIARNLRPDIRRFTLAHELGHSALHRNQGRRFRDYPLSGAELEDCHRDPVERDADEFAAELLMPEELMRHAFLRYFERESFAGAPRGEDIANQLSRPGRPVTAADLRERGKRYFSLLLADSRPWGYSLDLMTGPTLCKLFGVSITAMAIRLETLHLV